MGIERVRLSRGGGHGAVKYAASWALAVLESTDPFRAQVEYALPTRG